MIYVGGHKFSRHGRPETFGTLAAVAEHAKFLRRKFPVLRTYQLWAREL